MHAPAIIWTFILTKFIYLIFTIYFHGDKNKDASLKTNYMNFNMKSFWHVKKTPKSWIHPVYDLYYFRWWMCVAYAFLPQFDLYCTQKLHGTHDPKSLVVTKTLGYCIVHLSNGVTVYNQRNLTSAISKHKCRLLRQLVCCKYICVMCL